MSLSLLFQLLTLPGSLLGPERPPDHPLCTLSDKQGALVGAAGEGVEESVKERGGFGI